MAVQRVSTVSVIPQCDNLLIDVNALIHDATHDDSDMSMNASYEVVASRVMMVPGPEVNEIKYVGHNCTRK